MSKPRTKARVCVGPVFILFLAVSGCHADPGAAGDELAATEETVTASGHQASGTEYVEGTTDRIIELELGGLQGEEREAVRRIMVDNVGALAAEAQSEKADSHERLDQQALEELIAERRSFQNETCERRRRLYDSGSASQMVRAKEIEVAFLQDLIRELATKYFANPAFVESELDQQIGLLMDYARLRHELENPAGEGRGMLGAFALAGQQHQVLDQFVVTMVRQLFRQLADAHWADMRNDDARFDWESRSREWQQRWQALEGNWDC